MKVYKNVVTPGYQGGWMLVAANSVEEAHEVCMNCDKLEDKYWQLDIEYYKEKVNYVHEGWCRYNKNNFQEIIGLEWNGEPCVIEEHSYAE